MGETVCHILRGCLFQWDADKADRNLRAHGVTFEAACEVFFDPFYEYGGRYR
ncbi:MAG: BrnT family toxin [Thermodesulfobacteriota bacterium]